MKLGILTFHKAFNCGAALQAWALKTILEQMGHVVEFPNCNNVGLTKRFPKDDRPWPRHLLRFLKRLGYKFFSRIFSIPVEDLKRWRFAQFKRKYLTERNCQPHDFAQWYDAVVVGSDQVWREAISHEDAGLFFGETLPASLPKIAYAASYGDRLLEGEALQRVIEATKRFLCVSAREKLVKDQVETPSHKSIEVVLDPTLLLTKESYLPLIKNFKAPKEPYLFMYTLNTSPFYETAKQLAKRLGVKAIIAPMYQYSRLFAPSGLTYGISPDRLVGYMAHATYVVAASFHGTAFATIFNKPFLSLREHPENLDKLSRPGTLLKLTGNLDRIATPEMSIEEMLQRLQAPLVDNGALATAREHSLTWLKDALAKATK